MLSDVRSHIIEAIITVYDKIRHGVNCIHPVRGQT